MECKTRAVNMVNLIESHTNIYFKTRNPLVKNVHGRVIANKIQFSERKHSRIQDLFRNELGLLVIVVLQGIHLYYSIIYY